MATIFSPKTWVDRISEYPSRRKLTATDGTTSTVTVERLEGTVSEEGDAFSATNMNDLETRVDTAFDEINSNLSDNYSSTSTKFRFAIDGEGNYGYLKADDSFAPFKANVSGWTATKLGSGKTTSSVVGSPVTVTLDKSLADYYQIVVYLGAADTIDELMLNSGVSNKGVTGLCTYEYLKNLGSAWTTYHKIDSASILYMINVTYVSDTVVKIGTQGNTYTVTLFGINYN